MSSLMVMKNSDCLDVNARPRPHGCSVVRVNRGQDAKGQRVRYEYDKAQRLTALFNENNATYSFTYDSSSTPIPLFPPTGSAGRNHIRL